MASSRLFLERKSPRKTANSSTNPSAVVSLLIPSSYAFASSTPRRRCTPFTPASRSTFVASSVPTKSSSRFVARLLLEVIMRVGQFRDFRGAAD